MRTYKNIIRAPVRSNCRLDPIADYRFTQSGRGLRLTVLQLRPRPVCSTQAPCAAPFAPTLHLTHMLPQVPSPFYSRGRTRLRRTSRCRRERSP